MEKITDVRFWAAGDTTRVAIEVSGEFQFQTQRISGPDRVFFDLENTRAALKDNKPTTLKVGDGLVKQVRVAEKKPGTMRVVLDLEEGVDYAVSQLSNPERLMVEVRAAKAKPANSKQDTVKSTPAPVFTTPAILEVPVAVKAPVPPVAAGPNATLSVLIPPVFASIAGTAPAPSRGSANVAANIAPARPINLVEQPPAPSLPVAEPKPATRNATGERSLTRVLGLKLSRVVLDAGHGGHDPGTHSKSGMLEKDLVLDITNRLAELLRTRLGTDVIQTRTDDTFLSLEERTRLANEAKADLFLSIHANSSPVKSVAGIETFYLNFSAGRDDLDLATRENTTSQRSISDLQEVVTKIALRAKVDESREFALKVQNSLQSTAVKQNKDSKDRGVKRAPFVVLIGANMPSVLAEIGFLSNTRDEALLKGQEHRDRIAEALYNGIAAYAESLSPPAQVARK